MLCLLEEGSLSHKGGLILDYVLPRDDARFLSHQGSPNQREKWPSALCRRGIGDAASVVEINRSRPTVRAAAVGR